MRAAAFRISNAAKSKLLFRFSSAKPSLPLLVPASRASARTIPPFHVRRFSSSSSSSDDEFFSEGPPEIRERILLLTEKPSHLLLHVIPDDLRPTISDLATELLALPDNEDVTGTLDSGPAASLLERSPDGAAFIELLNQLKSRPLLALEVFYWRRKQGEAGSHPMQSEEYVKAITLAGRARNVEIADKLFSAATTDGLRTTSTYNALMAVYMYNGITKKSMSVFEDLKRDNSCSPTIVTYNILLSIFGRSVLVEQMETILRVIKESKLAPNISTYNTLIAGYLTAWMWNKMENTFREMEKGPVEPDTNTHLLMLRGYSHAGKLEKMEATYELVKEHVIEQKTSLLRAMVCAYCKSSDPERVRKIEELVGHIPRDLYRPWFNVILIRLYAQEGLLEKMENLISEALNQNTVVTTVNIMLSIITSYFRYDAVDRLSEFVKQAELAGWRLCRSIYHCKMVLYGRQQRFTEMQCVLNEMEALHIAPSQRTFLIMFKAYSNFGRRSAAQRIIGLMWKHGFLIPMDYVN